MKAFDKHSWKKKIDPDFDIAVKTFLRFMRDIKDSADNNYLAVKDEVLQPILDAQGWQNLYDGKEWQRLNDEMLEALRVGVEEGLKPENLIDERLPRKRKALKRWLISKTKGMSESSQNYYCSGISSFFNGTLLKPSWRLPEIKRRKAIEYNRKELGALFLALFCRILIHDLIGSDEDVADLIKDPVMLNNVMSLLYSIIAQISFQKTMYELLRNENDDDMLKAVTIDKGVVCTEVLKRRILRAELSGDIEFFKKLGRAISKKPVSGRSLHYETYIVLKLFWWAGLCKLKNQELYYFLRSCEVHPPTYPVALEKFLSKHIMPRGKALELP